MTLRCTARKTPVERKEEGGGVEVGGREDRVGDGGWEGGGGGEERGRRGETRGWGMGGWGRGRRVRERERVREMSEEERKGWR